MKSSAPIIPDLQEVNPEYQRLLDKQLELQANLSSLDREAAEITSLIRTKENASSTERVNLLIGDNGSDAETESEYAKMPAAKLRSRLLEVNQMRSDLREAVQVIGDRLMTEGYRASRTICEQMRPEYDAVVTELVQSVVALHRASVNYHTFRRALESNNVNWCGSLPIMTPAFAGLPYEKSSRLAHYLRKAVDEGYLESLPPEIS